jgi:hypothetical protein
MESKLISEINDITQHIKEYEKKLASVKYQLFMQRILTIVNNIANVKNVSFTSINNEWTIKYTCLVTYDENNYNNDEDSEIETELQQISFDMSFGKNKKYFILGNKQRFKIYRNSNNVLRILNSDYTADLDIEEQESLIASYSYNCNIPEWFAIRVLTFMEKNEWSDENLITYLDL